MSNGFGFPKAFPPIYVTRVGQISTRFTPLANRPGLAESPQNQRLAQLPSSEPSQAQDFSNAREQVILEASDAQREIQRAADFARERQWEANLLALPPIEYRARQTRTTPGAPGLRIGEPIVSGYNYVVPIPRQNNRTIHGSKEVVPVLELPFRVPSAPDGFIYQIVTFAAWSSLGGYLAVDESSIDTLLEIRLEDPSSSDISTRSFRNIPRNKSTSLQSSLTAQSRYLPISSGDHVAVLTARNVSGGLPPFVSDASLVVTLKLFKRPVVDQFTPLGPYQPSDYTESGPLQPLDRGRAYRNRPSPPVIRGVGAMSVGAPATPGSKGFNGPGIYRVTSPIGLTLYQGTSRESFGYGVVRHGWDVEVLRDAGDGWFDVRANIEWFKWENPPSGHPMQRRDNPEKYGYVAGYLCGSCNENRPGPWLTKISYDPAPAPAPYIPQYRVPVNRAVPGLNSTLSARARVGQVLSRFRESVQAPLANRPSGPELHVAPISDTALNPIKIANIISKRLDDTAILHNLVPETVGPNANITFSHGSGFPNSSNEGIYGTPYEGLIVPVTGKYDLQWGAGVSGYPQKSFLPFVNGIPWGSLGLANEADFFRDMPLTSGDVVSLRNISKTPVPLFSPPNAYLILIQKNRSDIRGFKPLRASLHGLWNTGATVGQAQAAQSRNYQVLNRISAQGISTLIALATQRSAG